MSRKLLVLAALALGGAHLAGCGNATPPTTSVPRNVDARYLLPSEPSGALGVVDFKEKAKSGEEVVVVGRIGGGVMPWIEGRAAFLLVDEGAPMPCEDDQCGPECKHCAQEIAECTTVVKFMDEQGKTLSIDSRELLGIKEEETVVVRGEASRDNEGSVALKASSIFVRR